METVWTFETARFRVALTIAPEYGYRYDGDDEGGETQAALDAGDLVAFDSAVTVYLDGVEVGFDCLGGSVYGANEVSDFWEAHRGADPMNRNCSTMRAARGNVSIGHYFPDMVRTAIANARRHLADAPAMRPTARH